MGNGGVGELPSMLFLVPLTFPGDEESVRSHAGRSPPGGAIRFRLFHSVQDPGGGV